MLARLARLLRRSPDPLEPDIRIRQALLSACLRASKGPPQILVVSGNRHSPLLKLEGVVSSLARRRLKTEWRVLLFPSPEETFRIATHDHHVARGVGEFMMSAFGASAAPVAGPVGYAATGVSAITVLGLLVSAITGARRDPFLRELRQAFEEGQSADIADMPDPYYRWWQWVESTASRQPTVAVVDIRRTSAAREVLTALAVFASEARVKRLPLVIVAGLDDTYWAQWCGGQEDDPLRALGERVTRLWLPPLDRSRLLEWLGRIDESLLSLLLTLGGDDARTTEAWAEWRKQKFAHRRSGVWQLDGRSRRRTDADIRQLLRSVGGDDLVPEKLLIHAAMLGREFPVQLVIQSVAEELGATIDDVSGAFRSLVAAHDSPFEATIPGQDPVAGAYRWRSTFIRACVLEKEAASERARLAAHLLRELPSNRSLVEEATRDDLLAIGRQTGEQSHEWANSMSDEAAGLDEYAAPVPRWLRMISTSKHSTLGPDDATSLAGAAMDAARMGYYRLGAGLATEAEAHRHLEKPVNGQHRAELDASIGEAFALCDEPAHAIDPLRRAIAARQLMWPEPDDEHLRVLAQASSFLASSLTKVGDVASATSIFTELLGRLSARWMGKVELESELGRVLYDYSCTVPDETSMLAQAVVHQRHVLELEPTTPRRDMFTNSVLLLLERCGRSESEPLHPDALCDEVLRLTQERAQSEAGIKPHADLARALHVSGRLAFDDGGMDLALARFEEASEIFEKLAVAEADDLYWVHLGWAHAWAARAALSIALGSPSDRRLLLLQAKSHNDRCLEVIAIVRDRGMTDFDEQLTVSLNDDAQIEALL